MKVAGAGPALLAAGAAGALVYLGELLAGPPQVALKTVPVLALAAWVALRGRDRRARLTVSGLALSAIGDVLLEVGRFLPGLFGFLAGHVAYLGGFLSSERRPALARALPFVAWGITAFAALRADLGASTLPVAGYMAVINAMMWRAAACVGSPANPRRAAWLGLAGALAFGASDTLLAFNRFGTPIAGAPLAIMLLYWLGQWGIAASTVLAGAPPRAGEAGGHPA